MMAEGLGVTPVYEVNKESDGMFGGGGMWLFFLFFLLAWGGNGIGGFGGNAAAATVANGVNNDFMYSNLSAQLRDNSIQNNSILNGIQQGLSNIGYENLNNARETQMLMMQGFNTTQSQMASCCCGIEKELLTNRYEAEKNTSAIVQAIHADGEATRGLITQNTIQDLRDRLCAAELANSQCAQNAYLTNALRPYPVPAFPASTIFPPCCPSTVS